MNTQALFFERIRQGEETALDYYFNEHTESLCFIAFKLVKDELVNIIACTKLLRIKLS